MHNQQEEQAIIAETQAFQEAWNRGDAKGSASFCTEDATGG
jgi:ketosteroid isomerase-like protein